MLRYFFADGYPEVDDIEEKSTARRERRERSVQPKSYVDESLKHGRRGAVQLELPANKVQENRRKGIALDRGSNYIFSNSHAEVEF